MEEHHNIIVPLKIIAFVFTALFPVVNPVGTAFVLFGMTGSLHSPDGKKLARHIAIYSFFLLAFFFLFGRYILMFFGISMPIVQLAGGTVLALMGWQLLNAPAVDHDKLADPAKLRPLMDERAFYPYTFPLTIGPGCLAVAITLSAHLSGDAALKHKPFDAVVVLMGIALICFLTFLCYYRLGLITQKLTANAIHAMSKLLSFVVICIGCEIAWNGIKSLH